MTCKNQFAVLHILAALVTTKSQSAAGFGMDRPLVMQFKFNKPCLFALVLTTHAYGS